MILGDVLIVTQNLTSAKTINIILATSNLHFYFPNQVLGESDFVLTVKQILITNSAK